MEKYIVYLRVSTQKQGNSGLGLSAQRSICEKYIQSQEGEIVGEFIDVVSGKREDRKQLWKAIDLCKDTGATLIVARMDRLARNTEFVFKVVNTGINIYFCDMPVVNTLILGVMASIAQYERELISKRTKDALQANKERGVLCGRGNPNWKSDEETLRAGYNKTAITLNLRVIESPEFLSFARIMRKVVPILEEYSTSEEKFFLRWTKCRYEFKLTPKDKETIRELMEEANRNNNELFAGVDFSPEVFPNKLRSRIQSMFNTISKYNELNYESRQK
jgi:DNA invertase Pin-like site-specific DNA recombinase